MSRHTEAKHSKTSTKQPNRLGAAPQAPKAGQNGHN